MRILKPSLQFIPDLGSGDLLVPQMSYNWYLVCKLSDQCLCLHLYRLLLLMSSIVKSVRGPSSIQLMLIKGVVVKWVERRGEVRQAGGGDSHKSLS